MTSAYAMTVFMAKSIFWRTTKQSTVSNVSPTCRSVGFNLLEPTPLRERNRLNNYPNHLDSVCLLPTLPLLGIVEPLIIKFRQCLSAVT